MSEAERTVVVFCEEYARGAFVVQALTTAGYTVRWVQGVETALHIASREQVDALVADARSDDMVDALVAGWRRRTQRRAPVVLLTRETDGSSAQLADEVVSSPLTVEEVTQTVRRAIGEWANA